MRYLIIKTSAFGDIVQTYPVVEYIRSRFPRAVIDWVVEKKAASLVRAHPYVHRTIEVNAKEWKKKPFSKTTRYEVSSFLANLRKERYNAVFDLQGNAKSALITFFSLATTKVGFGWKSVPEKLNCLATNFKVNPPRGENIRYEYLHIVRSYFQDDEAFSETHLPLVLSQNDDEIFAANVGVIRHNTWLICPSSQWKNKMVPVETLIPFLKRAEAIFHPYFIFLSGSEEENLLARKLASHFSPSSVYDRLPLPVLQHLMHKMDLIVSMDSLPLHLAGTTGKPTFSFFGPSLAMKYIPPGDHFFVQGACKKGITFERRCAYLRSCSEAICIKNFILDNYWSRFEEWYRNKHVQ